VLQRYIHLGMASVADNLLAHLALLSSGEDAEARLHAEEADLAPPHVLLDRPVQR